MQKTKKEPENIVTQVTMSRDMYKYYQQMAKEYDITYSALAKMLMNFGVKYLDAKGATT